MVETCRRRRLRRSSPRKLKLNCLWKIEKVRGESCLWKSKVSGIWNHIPRSNCVRSVNVEAIVSFPAIVVAVHNSNNSKPSNQQHKHGKFAYCYCALQQLTESLQVAPPETIGSVCHSENI